VSASSVVETDDLFELTAALIAVPSVTGDEDALTGAVETRLRVRGTTLTIDRVGASVVARTNCGGDRRVVLGGHLDTVPANGNADPRVDGHTLHGLGSADMKSGVAVLLRLADALAEHPGAARHDVTIVLYEGEEGPPAGDGVGLIFDRCPELLAGDLAVLLEPTDGWVEAGCQGALVVEARFDGERAHAARPWLGRNAIHAAAPALARLAAFEAATVHVDGLAYREALQVVGVDGGVATNVVPDRCVVRVSRRFAPSRSGDDAVAELERLLDGADAVEVTQVLAPAPPNLRNPLVDEFVSTLGLSVRPKLGWTDVARFAQRGIPALNFGPGDPTLAHTAHESVTRGAIERTYATLATFLGLPAASPPQ
jgi:succinyl-diaminopimelate desuccinylase